MEFGCLNIETGEFLQGYIDKNTLPIQTMHIADVLAHGWGNV